MQRDDDLKKRVIAENNSFSPLERTKAVRICRLGALTLSIMTLSKTTLSIMKLNTIIHSTIAKHRYAECCLC
jgi:hypothetical protein